MEKILLTGFMPFGSYQWNPTQDIVENYHTKTIADRIVIGLVLPCTYFGAFEILSKIIDTEKPCAIISLGLSSSVKKVRIETYFQNKMASKYADANGYMPHGVPINRGSNKLRAQADHQYLCEILQSEKIPSELSEDADAFICNSLGYLTTQKIQQEHSFVKNMFIHIPWTDNYANKVVLEPEKVFIKKKDVCRAIELLVTNI